MFFLPFFVLFVSLFASVQLGWSHCQVPCGIYHDDLRFETMNEDVQTIKKASIQITELATKESAIEKQQLVRWTQAKDDHADNLMKIIFQYFLAQRIKPNRQHYDQILREFHAIILDVVEAKHELDPDLCDQISFKLRHVRDLYNGQHSHLHPHPH